MNTVTLASLIFVRHVSPDRVESELREFAKSCLISAEAFVKASEKVGTAYDNAAALYVQTVKVESIFSELYMHAQNCIDAATAFDREADSYAGKQLGLPSTTVPTVPKALPTVQKIVTVEQPAKREAPSEEDIQRASQIAPMLIQSATAEGPEALAEAVYQVKAQLEGKLW